MEYEIKPHPLTLLIHLDTYLFAALFFEAEPNEVIGLGNLLGL